MPRVMLPTGPQNGLLGSAFRNIQNVAGLKLHIFGFAIQDFLQVELHFAC